MFRPLVDVEMAKPIVEDQGHFHESWNKEQKLLDGKAGT
jgi:hypothetical protein